MSWQFSMNDPSMSRNSYEPASEQITEDQLRQHADEWLGQDKSFKDLEVWEQRALLADIEADMLQLRLQTIYEVDTY